MLEKWRYQRALEASSQFPDRASRQVFLDQELLTQMAIAGLGTTLDLPPSQASKVGSLLVRPEDVATLRLPFAVEVLGPPGAGKGTMINRYLHQLWRENRRHEVAFVPEGARTAKEVIGDWRMTDPFSYSVAASLYSIMTQEISVLRMNAGAWVILSDRGQIDRRVFRRAYFTQGKVDPFFFQDEPTVIDNFENTPMQIGGLIMLLIRPEVAYWSRGGDGLDHPVRNMDLLPRLYEQYLRLHYEILAGQVPYRVYTCIDAEAEVEEVYERFAHAMDTILNIQTIFLHALAKAFPQEFDKAWRERRRIGRRRSPAEEELGRRLGGKKVLIVGGDDMESKEEVSGKPYVEAIALKGNIPPGPGVVSLRQALRALARS